MEFADRLRELRKERGMSLEDVGKCIGVQRSNVYKYEHGIVKNIPPEKAKVLADVFNVSVAYLMGWTDKRNADVPEKIGSIALPNNELFVKAYSVMTQADRMMLMEIFNRAYAKIRFEENKY